MPLVVNRPKGTRTVVVWQVQRGASPQPDGFDSRSGIVQNLPNLSAANAAYGIGKMAFTGVIVEENGAVRLTSDYEEYLKNVNNRREWSKNGWDHPTLNGSYQAGISGSPLPSPKRQ